MQNMGQPEFEDYEVVPGPVIDVNTIVAWCLDKMQDYEVKKITMDTYRYNLFKMEFEAVGLTVEGL